MLRKPLTNSQIEELIQWLTLGSTTIEKWEEGWHFWIYNGSFLGLAETSDARGGQPFHLVFEEFGSVRPTDPEFEAYLEEERVMVQSHLGFVPAQEISLSAWCNRDLDHRLLGHLALRLAERFDGLIDMEGAITSPVAPGRVPRLVDYPWCTQEEVSAYVRQMSGRIWEIPYEMASGEYWMYHIVDAVFLRAWMLNPRFRMIK